MRISDGISKCHSLGPGQGSCRFSLSLCFRWARRFLARAPFSCALSWSKDTASDLWRLSLSADTPIFFEFDLCVWWLWWKTVQLHIIVGEERNIRGRSLGIIWLYKLRIRFGVSYRMGYSHVISLMGVPGLNPKEWVVGIVALPDLTVSVKPLTCQ